MCSPTQHPNEVDIQNSAFEFKRLQFKKDGKFMGRPSTRAPRMYFKEEDEARAER